MTTALFALFAETHRGLSVRDVGPFELALIIVAALILAVCVIGVFALFVAALIAVCGWSMRETRHTEDEDQ